MKSRVYNTITDALENAGIEFDTDGETIWIDDPAEKGSTLFVSISHCDRDEEEPEAESGFICPLHQRPCDQECSWAEKANCEYYQGLSAAK